MAGTYTQPRKNVQVSSPVDSANKMYTATSGKRIADSVIGAIVSGQQQSAMKNAYRNKLLEQQRKENEIRQQMASTQQGVNKTQMGLAMAKDIINTLAKTGVIRAAFDKVIGQEPATQAPVPAPDTTPTVTAQTKPDIPSAAATETDIGDKGAFGGTDIGVTETTGIGAEVTSESPTDPSIADSAEKYQNANDNLFEAENKLKAAVNRAKRSSADEDDFKAYERAKNEYDKANRIMKSHGKILADVGSSVMGKGALAYNPEGEIVPALTLTDASGDMFLNPNARVFDTVSVKGDPTLMGEDAGDIGSKTELKMGQEQFNPVSAALAGVNLASGISDIIEKGATIGNVPGVISSGLSAVNQAANAAIKYGSTGVQEAGRAVTGALAPALKYIPYAGTAISAAPSAYGAVKSAMEGGLDPNNKQQFARMHNQINDVADKIIMVVQPWYALGRGAATLVNKIVPDDQTVNTIMGFFDPAGMLSGEHKNSLQNKTFGTWICTAVKKHTYLTNDEEDVIAKLRVYAKEKHNKWFRLYLVHGMKLVNAIAKQEKDLKEFYTNIREILVKPVTELFDKDNEAAYQLYHKTTELLRSKYLPELIVDGGELCPYKV